ncbi:hypothetical protein H310_01366 [Aphanomyces invadans]|uniref:Uncharacterized protein n=1 Tax=Aphanomyces invadans TaxID=157072 RepID=A0A024UQZ9_9STRA|nr:hypothetical protein H310_01366 [Aphanomyces invadans]ETW08871.1 hypothetical protein H310_01366 [Aphanomyces invadans]|eukprot:XP_008862676.1 hypothetical protein H310_01366 [Aphanomyces invadans]
MDLVGTKLLQEQSFAQFVLAPCNGKISAIYSDLLRLLLRTFSRRKRPQYHNKQVVVTSYEEVDHMVHATSCLGSLASILVLSPIRPSNRIANQAFQLVGIATWH